MPEHRTSRSAPVRVRAKSKLRENLEGVLWALLIALLVRSFVVQSFFIPSGSMEQTLAIGDRLLVSKCLYGIRLPFGDRWICHWHEPRRGDVVVFTFPPDPGKDLIKRVVGLPGDEIQIRDKQVYVNGVPYRNPHERHGDPAIVPAQAGPRDNLRPIRVPPHSYFVMGDNRDFSYDSRFWGFVPERDLVGKALVKYWSWDKQNGRVRWGNIGRWVD